MARLTGPQRRAANKRDPIAELTARIAKIREKLKGDTKRGKSSQQNSLRVLEQRLANYKTNKAQFGNVYGQRGGNVISGRGAQKNKEKAEKLRIKKRMNTDSGESEEQEWGPKGQPSASSQIAKTDKKVNKKKVVKKKTNEKLKVNKTEKKTESSSSSNDSDRAAWLKKTRNSPAAKAGLSDDQRWEAQKRHREWKKKRKK